MPEKISVDKLDSLFQSANVDDLVKNDNVQAASAAVQLVAEALNSEVEEKKSPGDNSGTPAPDAEPTHSPDTLQKKRTEVSTLYESIFSPMSPSSPAVPPRVLLKHETAKQRNSETGNDETVNDEEHLSQRELFAGVGGWGGKGGGGGVNNGTRNCSSALRTTTSYEGNLHSYDRRWTQVRVYFLSHL